MEQGCGVQQGGAHGKDVDRSGGSNFGYEEELMVLMGIMRGVGSLVMHQVESKSCNCNLLIH